MEIRVIKTGNIYHIPVDAMYQILLEGGVIERVVKPAAERKLGSARWWVRTDVYSDQSVPAIAAHCDACNAHQIFHSAPRIPDNNGVVPPSTMHKCFLEHCKKREFVPKDVLEKYFAAKDEVNF